MTPLWNVTVLTILPEAYPGPLQQSLAGKALSQNLWTLCVVDIRSFAEDKHKTVDDKPFGGGVGMVMLPTVVGAALDHVIASKPQAKLLYLTPRGKLLNQKKIQSLIKQDVIILSGRFEGLDQRVIDKYNLEEVSIGDYVLSGGDIAALVLIDAGVRLLPGVTNNEVAKQESFGTEGPYESLL
jgi:tRNA (guanine37-N1)-methyltransferase